MTQDDQRRRAEEFLKRASFLPDAIALLAPVLANFAAEAIEQLPAIIAAKNADAERYRWILTKVSITDFIFKFLKSRERHVSNAIDAARAGGETK